MDAGSLNAAEELVLGCGLVATAWLLLAIARKLLAYALSGALVVVGVALAASMFVYRPSRVYAWIERSATDEWSRAPNSEQLIDRSIAGLHWLEGRMAEAKQTVDRPAPSRTSTGPAARTRPKAGERDDGLDGRPDDRATSSLSP